jgi:flavorubredoxin
MADKKKLVYVVYYSMYGHVQTLAREVAKGVELAGG